MILPSPIRWLVPPLVLPAVITAACVACRTDRAPAEPPVSQVIRGPVGGSGDRPVPVSSLEAEGAVRPVTLQRPGGFSRPFLFSASDGTHGYELFAYDGMRAPVMVADINTVYASSGDGSRPSGMTVLGSRAYFSADDGRKGRELHFYDMVSGAHGIAAEIDKADEEGSDPDGLFMNDGILFFSADDRVSGRELWSYDPAAGAARLYDLCPDVGSDPGPATRCGGSLYFLATSPCGSDRRTLWSLEGSGTFPTTVAAARHLNVKELSREAPGGTMLLGADDGSGKGMEPWSFDCVNDRASPLGDFNPYGGSNPSGFAFVGSKAFFRADDGVHGAEVWWLDQSAGTRGMIELNPWGDTSPSELTPFAGKLFFTGFDVNFRLLCFTDAVPSAVVSCFPDIHDPAGLRLHEGALFFSAFVPCRGECSESLGRELWRYDGIRTPRMVEDIWPGPGNGM